MFEVARYEGERRLVLAATIAVAASFYGAMVVALSPSFTDFDLEAILSNLPQQFTEGLGVTALDTLPGLLAVELFQVGWVLVLGLYLAYSAASIVAGDVETGRMDTLLAAPVSRSKLVVEELCCAAVGFAASVFLREESRAQIASIGVLVVAFLVETLLIGTDYEVLGAIAPMNYFDPTEILVEGNYDVEGGIILLAAAAVLVVASQWRFTRMDIQ
ncbi:ABC transporter permease [Halobacteriales archaeon SW_12_67_38]|nr:MAG: ABC transporter permease [Halobacteriales archaeon SW_12_67_38]